MKPQFYRAALLAALKCEGANVVQISVALIALGKNSPIAAKRIDLVLRSAVAPLHALPDSEFELGGSFDALARLAGYASGRQVANDLKLWDGSVGEAIRTICAD